jgi:serine-type D-Ala-D-Ala carboxypeptidase
VIQALLQAAVDHGVAPLIRLEVFHHQRHALSLGNATPECLFDLASLTKVMSTTALMLDQSLAIESALQRFLPTAVVPASLGDLLYHRSGLPAFKPFFAPALAAHTELCDAEPRPELRAAVRRQVIDAVAATPAEHRVGSAAVYSDLGFILLGAALETACGSPLDHLFATRVATPLGLSAHYRRISAALPVPACFAPTGVSRPREPAPGQEGQWAFHHHPTAPAQVDDDNAFCMDGVSGHAGLFGTALDVARFGQAILEGRFAPITPWKRDLTPGSTRALGFDTPSAEGASCGPRFGRAGPRGAIGHLGFTGTSLWIDFDRHLVVALLTNRVALGRSNLRIREFRPQVHEAVLDALLTPSPRPLSS